MTASTTLPEIHRLLNQGQYSDALQAIEAVLLSTKDVSAAFHTAGLCCFGMGQWPKALSFFEQAHSYSPERQASLIGMASTMIRLGRMSEGLYHYKLSLTVEPEVNPDLLPSYIDFNYNLILWRQNMGLLLALDDWSEGHHADSIALMQQYIQTRDPSAEQLITLINWLNLSHKVVEALELSVQLNRDHGESMAHQMVFTETVASLDSRQATEQAAQIIADSDDLDVVLSALACLPGDTIADHASQLRALLSRVPLPEQTVLPEQDELSLGLFIDQFHPSSLSVWLFPALQYLVQSDIQLMLYVEECDHWGRLSLESLGIEIIETQEIDDITLKYIIGRNQHTALWCLSAMGHYRRSRLLLESHVDCMGLLWPSSVLKNTGLAGFSGVMPPHSSSKNVPASPNVSFADYPLLVENDVVTARKRVDADTFFIAMAMQPRHVKSYQSLIVELLAIETIALSFDRRLLSEYGEDLLAALLQEHPEYEGRLVLENDVDYLLPEHARRHLLTCDAYISVGMPIYDFLACCSVSIPSVALYDPLATDQGIFYHLMQRHADQQFTAQSTKQVVDVIREWQLSDVWENAQFAYEQYVQHCTNPAQNLSHLDVWLSRLTPEVKDA